MRFTRYALSVCAALVLAVPIRAEDEGKSGVFSLISF